MLHGAPGRWMLLALVECDVDHHVWCKHNKPEQLMAHNLKIHTGFTSALSHTTHVVLATLNLSCASQDCDESKWNGCIRFHGRTVWFDGKLNAHLPWCSCDQMAESTIYCSRWAASSSSDSLGMQLCAQNDVDPNVLRAGRGLKCRGSTALEIADACEFCLWVVKVCQVSGKNSCTHWCLHPNKHLFKCFDGWVLLNQVLPENIKLTHLLCRTLGVCWYFCGGQCAALG